MGYAKRRFLGLCAVLALCPAAAGAAPLKIEMPDWETVPVIDHDLGRGVHVIESFGGNIGVVASDDGPLLVDAGYPQLHARILAALRKLGPRPARLVVNTHFHWDHTGGNADFAREGAILVASDATRRHIQERQGRSDNRPGEFLPDAAALPQFTLAGDATLSWGGQTVRLIRLPGTHTDGDLVVQFVEADVIQTGDALMTDFYPFIDVAHGGGIEGMIALSDRVAAMAGPATRIVPGHGPIGRRDDVIRFGQMLRTVRDRAAAALAGGIDRDSFVAGQPLADLDARWGGNLIKGPAFAAMVYADLARKR